MNRSIEESPVAAVTAPGDIDDPTRTCARDGALIAVAGLIPAASVAAAEPTEPVLDWNINAVNAIGNPPSERDPRASASRLRSR